MRKPQNQIHVLLFCISCLACTGCAGLKDLSTDLKLSEQLAKADLAILNKEPNQALNACEAALVIDPQSANALVPKATALRMLQRYEESRAAANDVLKLNGVKKPTDYLRYRALSERAQDEMALKDTKKALADCNAVIKEAPEQAFDAYCLRAKINRAQNHLTEALADNNAACKLIPNNSRMLLDRATTYVAQKDYEHAIADCTQAIAIPLSSQAKESAKSGKLSKAARAEYDDLIAAYELRYKIYTETGKPDPAAADFDMAKKYSNEAGIY